MGCPNSQTLGAYHDCELDVAAADEIRGHIAVCHQCRGYLEELNALSAAIDDDAEVLCALPIEMARIQSSVRISVRKAVTGTSLRRTAALLGALAASVLVISAAWLLDPDRDAVQGGSADAPVALAPEWERLACTLHAEPRPAATGDLSPYSLRYAAVVDWMLQNHVPSERKPWEKPL